MCPNGSIFLFQAKASKPAELKAAGMGNKSSVSRLLGIIMRGATSVHPFSNPICFSYKDEITL